MGRQRIGPTAAVLVALLGSGGAARADEVAAAEALYQEGRRLMKAGELAQACLKLEESQSLDPGTGTLWHLARCYAATERLASAWARYHELAALARSRGEQAKVDAALAAAEEVEPLLHKLVLSVAAASRVEGLELTLDGVPVGPGAFGTEVPVDRGSHRIRAVAPGREPWETEVDIEGPAAVATVEVPVLEKVVAPSAATLPLEPKLPPPSPGPRRDTSRWYGDPIGWTLTATGAVLLAGGGGALLRAGQLITSADRQTDLDVRDRRFDAAERYQLAGGALLVTGGGILAAGVVKLALHGGEEERDGEGKPVSIELRRQAIVLGFSGDF